MNTSRRIAAHITVQPDATITVSGLAVLFSRVVGEVVGSLPNDAKVSPTPMPDIAEDGRIDSTFRAHNRIFGNDFTVSRASDIDTCTEWFSKTVESSVRSWFDKRDSLEKLTEIATTPERYSWFEKNIPPSRVRATVALCLVNGETVRAAEIMNWYLRRPRGFNTSDSLDKAKAFDAALSARFAGYSR